MRARGGVREQDDWEDIVTSDLGARWVRRADMAETAALGRKAEMAALVDCLGGVGFGRQGGGAGTLSPVMPAEVEVEVEEESRTTGGVSSCR